MSKGEVLEKYVAIVRQFGGAPTNAQMEAAGLTRNAVRYNWGTMSELEVTCREFYPDAWNDIPLEQAFSSTPLPAAPGYVVTTAVVGCQVHVDFLRALQAYCKRRKFQLVILVAADPASRRSPGGYGYISKDLTGCHVLAEDARLNDNLLLSTMLMSAKQINPETGLKRLTHSCAVYASPKIRHEIIPTTGKLPRAIMTTGAVTLPDYETNRYMSKRTGAIAHQDHTIGALVLEIQDEKLFHVRQLYANEQGGFTDINRVWSPFRGPRKVGVEALVLGDYHAAHIRQRSKDAIASIARETRPRLVVVHDLFDGDSINHHDKDKAITLARKADRGRLSLADELAHTAKELRFLAGLGKEVVIVRSNHNLFLERYLESGRYHKDPHNMTLGTELALAMCNGLDPLRVGIEKFDPPKNIRWLGKHESFKVAGVELSCHGHLGPNGSRGSPKALEPLLGPAITAHNHSPGILRGLMTVGTSVLEAEYTEGPSSWMETHGLLHFDGGRQLLSVINDEWRA